MLPARTSNEQCRQHGGGPVHDVVIWKRDGAGGCQNLLVRNVWKMLPDRTAAKYVVGYEFWSVSGFCHQQPAREGWVRHEGNVDKARLNLRKIRGGV
jgi:hypothetical protein